MPTEGQARMFEGKRQEYHGGKWVFINPSPVASSKPAPTPTPTFNIDTDGDGIKDTYMEGISQAFYDSIMGDDGGGGGGGGYAPDPWSSTAAAAEYDAAQRAAMDERGQGYWREQFAAEEAAKKAAAELQAQRDRELEDLRNKFTLTRDEQQHVRDLERDTVDYERRLAETREGRAFEANQNERDRAWKSKESADDRAWQTQLETMKEAASEKRFQAQLASDAADRDQRYASEAARLNQEAALAEKGYQQAIKLEEMRQKGDITLEQIRQTGAMEQLKFSTAAEYKMKLEDLKAQRYNTFVEMLGKDPARAVLFGLGLGPQAEAFNQQEQMYTQAMLPLLGTAQPGASTTTGSPTAPAPTSGTPTSSAKRPPLIVTGTQMKALGLDPNLYRESGSFGKYMLKSKQPVPAATPSPAALPPLGTDAPLAPTPQQGGPTYYDPRVSSLSPVMSELPGARKLKADVETALSGLLGRQVSVGTGGVTGLGSVEQAATAYQGGDENIQNLLASAFGIGELSGAGGTSPEGVARKIQAVTPKGIL